MKQPARAPQGKTKAPKDKRKSREDLNQKARDRKNEKKHRGNASGSRANPVAASQNKGNDSQAKDPRIGSKKPIPLGVEGQQSKPAKVKKAVVEKKPKLSPQEELAGLENNERLDALLDRLENGEVLSAEEQAWLDQTLDRIDVLMEQLGIELGDDEDGDEAEEDMYRLLKGSN